MAITFEPTAEEDYNGTINVAGDGMVMLNTSTVSGSGFVVISIKEPESNFNAKAYPNPFSDILYLEFDGNTTTTRIEMVNLTGSVVRVFENITSHTITLQCGDLPSGIYFIKVYSDKVYVDKVLRR